VLVLINNKFFVVNWLRWRGTKWVTCTKAYCAGDIKDFGGMKKVVEHIFTQNFWPSGKYCLFFLQQMVKNHIS
jgi:hypothetical protein